MELDTLFVGSYYGCKEGQCQELRYIGGYDGLSGGLVMSIRCLL